MSIFPCDVHERRVPGALESYRVTVMSGSDRYTRRVRLCHDHFMGALSDLEQFMARISDDSDELVEDVCKSCGSKSIRTGSTVAAFGWAYPRNTEPITLYGTLCGSCGAALVAQQKLDLEIDSPDGLGRGL